MKELFPFERKRESQRELISAVECALEERKNLIAHAPTGIGKTAAVLAPALGYALENSKKVLFLTPRHSQHVIVIETLKMIKKRHEVDFRAVDIIGKRWLCPIEGIDKMGSSDFAEYCKNAKVSDLCTHYNRTLNNDLTFTEEGEEALSKVCEEIVHAEELKYKLGDFCVYELLLRLMGGAHVIIADYYHLFHPIVRKVIMEHAESALKDMIVVVDEAHNLPDRTRSLLSHYLTSYQVERAQKEASFFGFREEELHLKKLGALLKEMAKHELKEHREVFLSRGALIEGISNFIKYEDFITALEGIAKEVRRDRKNSFCGGVSRFLEAWNSEDEKGFTRILRKERTDRGLRISLRHTCLDPQISTSVLNKAHSAILMSGTLTPTDMYLNLLGLEPKRTEQMVLSSPFPKENKLNIVLNTVTTKYSMRDEDQYRKIGWLISKTLKSVAGNVAVFFPSYELRDSIARFVQTKKHIINEKPRITKEEKSSILKQFFSLRAVGAVLFGVIGGNFDQGVDYPGNLMNGVIIVGLPLGRPDLETQALIDFYEYKFGKGWEYGYIFPGVNKAIQASGRCIRSEDDKGVAVFMDERYLWNNYRKVFPPEFNLRTSKAPWKEIERFYGC